MGQTLTNGIYLPDEGERNSYPGLEVNWRTLDALILTVNGKAAPNVANTWTAAQTFTAGITGDLTGNVTGNVTGDLTGTAAKAIADEDGTSIKTGYGKLAGNQTWTGLNTYSIGQIKIQSLTQEVGVTPQTSTIQYLEFVDKNNVQHGLVGLWDYDNGTSEIQLNIRDTFSNGAKDPTGTSDTAFFSFGFLPTGVKFVTFSGQLNNSVIPLTNSTYTLGTSSYRWSSVYADSYYYGTTSFTDKFVTTDTSQTITGIKTFASTIYSKIDATTLSSYKDIYQCQNDAGNRVVTFRVTHSNSARILSINIHDNNNSAPKGIVISNDGSNNISLTGGGSSNDLGTSTNRWKTLNGVNPGALSLPARDYVSSMDIDTTNWDLTGTTFYYTPTIDGWLQISVAPSNNYAYIAIEYATLRSNCENTTGRNAMITIPVVANKSYDITIIGSTISRARLAFCQGNV